MRESSGANSSDVILELDRITKQFGRVTAVDQLSERFVRGEYCCILGPSGCGKTTLLRLIAGFETPDTGSIRLHGTDVVRTPPERRDVNVVFQHYALFPHLSVTENVGFGLRMRKLARPELTERVRATIALVHLEDAADRLPRQLSGGQQQRVALARALVNRPAVLLLDEPLSALDYTLRRRMQEELRRIQRETGVTFLHITHDQSEALTLGDRVAVMRAGRFVQIGSPRDVYLRPSSRFVASFVGATNLIPAHADASGHAAVAGGTRVRLPRATALRGPVLLAIRPEAIRLVHAADASEHAVHATVRHVAFAGAEFEVVVELADDTVVRVRHPSTGGESFHDGAVVTLVVEADDIVVLPPEDEP